jgi:hypothetical protein
VSLTQKLGKRGCFEMDSRNELMDVVESNRVAFILLLESDGDETDVGRYC